ncbi:response regulator transcription factor [Candidatus Nitrospira bockiana]
MSRPSASEYAGELVGLADRRSGPGILILTASGQLQYMNRRSWELLKALNDCQTVAAAGGLLPAAVPEICAEIQRLEQNRLDSKDWEQIEIRRLAGTERAPVLLRGFGLPAHQGGHSRVLIIMETIGRRETIALQAKERFQLTEREQSVVERLAKGWTNKEIAAALKITEPTVKAHIRNIMEKTKCTTRTGIVAQILHA